MSEKDALIGNPRPDMNGRFQSFHVRDPDGWDLQISNQTDTSEL